jgi:glycosyltransferase involved in cell wall biosynthesis
MVIASRNTLYPLFSLRMGRALARAAASRSYAAVIAQGLTAFGAVVHRKRLEPRAPVILNPQGMEEFITPSALKRLAYLPFQTLARYAARHAQWVIATDEVLAEPVARVLRVARERIRVIPNPIDAEDCRARVDTERGRRVLAELGCTGASPIIVTVGRLAPNKGFAVGLEALARVSQELGPSWRWIVVGEGPERAALERRIRALGLTDRVRLAGRRDDIDSHSLLAAADLFLNPTLYEGSSLVTLEAMAHARPIVATRAGGIPDKVLAGETGWLAEPGDPISLAEAILRWRRTDGARRARVGEAARRRVAERFDWPQAITSYVELIRAAAGGHIVLTAKGREHMLPR